MGEIPLYVWGGGGGGMLSTDVSHKRPAPPMALIYSRHCYGRYWVRERRGGGWGQVSHTYSPWSPRSARSCYRGEGVRRTDVSQLSARVHARSHRTHTVNDTHAPGVVLSVRTKCRTSLHRVFSSAVHVFGTPLLLMRDSH